MQNVWGFFGIIYLSAYTANMTSFIADTSVTLKVDGIYDNKVRYVVFIVKIYQ